MRKMDATLSFYMDGLYGYAMVLTGDATVAADLVQETYVRATESMARLREPSNAKAWLYTILRNIRLNQVRQRQARPRLLTDENTADLVIETAKYPTALYVRKVEIQTLLEAIQLIYLTFIQYILY